MAHVLVRELLNLWNDTETKELATNLGESLLLDKRNLVGELVPAN
jgi:hypothetical protein